jgi:hypothetical protein
VDWNWLSTNPNAIHLLEKYPDKISWGFLSKNPNAIHILKTNPEKIYWKYLSENPSIFENDIKQTQLEILKKANNIDIYE